MVEKSSTTRNFMSLLTSDSSSRSRFTRRFTPDRASPTSRAFSRTSAWPCIWQTRDSRHLQHRADFLQVQLVVVVQGHHQALALRQLLRSPPRAPREILVDHVAERIRALVSTRPSSDHHRRSCRPGSRSGSSPRPARSCGTRRATRPCVRRSRRRALRARTPLRSRASPPRPRAPCDAPSAAPSRACAARRASRRGCGCPRTSRNSRRDPAV